MNDNSNQPGTGDLPKLLSTNAIKVVRRMLLLLVAACIIIYVLAVMSQSTQRYELLTVQGIVIPLWCYFELRRNRVNRALLIFSWVGWVAACTSGFYVAGLHTPILFVLPLSVMICAWVQGRGWAIFMTAASIGMLCLIEIAAQRGLLLPPVLRSTSQILLVYCLVIAFVGLFAVMIAKHLKALSAHDHKISEDLAQRVAALAKSENALLEQTAELEAALDSLQQSRDKLADSEAKATLSTLIASVSHELRTPIGNGVLTASVLADSAREFSNAVESGKLKRSDVAAFASQLTEASSLMLRNMKRANDLLLNFQQVAADQVSEQRRHFNLAQVAQEIIDTLAPSLKRHPHKVNLDIASDIAMDSYPGPLGQVFINLINNAYLHAFEGRTGGIVTIRGSVHGEWVHLSFHDNGVGIEEENLPKLFQPFFSTKIGKGGTGLGMAIVENLITKALGGSIKVISTPAEGTRFDIQIPRVM